LQFLALPIPWSLCGVRSGTLTSLRMSGHLKV
jgi:hypothetical protein